MGGDCKVQDSAAIVSEEHQHEQLPVRHRWDHEEVSGDQLVLVIGQERAPRLRGRPSTADHVHRHCPLADRETELEQFAVNPWSAPGGRLESTSSTHSIFVTDANSHRTNRFGLFGRHNVRKQGGGLPRSAV
jgi:hypothetical protein